jgi:hypothetical protein
MFNRNKDDLCNVVNVLAEGGYSGENFACKIKEIIVSTVEVIKKMSYINLKHCLKGGSLSVVLHGLKNAEGFEKTAKEKFRQVYK